MSMSEGDFEVVCEIQPPTRPNLMAVRHQIGVMSRVAAAFLVPDNHLGRATLSSIAVAHEVDRMGGRSVACLNARDRNLLGLRRDLLTAVAYGVDEFLFVYGDRPASGARVGELTVGSMMEELRSFAPFAEAGVVPKVGVTPDWDPSPLGRPRLTSSSSRLRTGPTPLPPGGIRCDSRGRSSPACWFLPAGLGLASGQPRSRKSTCPTNGSPP